MKCRHCQTELTHVFADLQFAPVSNAMLNEEQLNEPEQHFPLKIFVCHHCFLVQTAEIKKADQIFDDEYTYFSSYSSSWLKHAEKYVNMMIERFGFNEKSQVIEVASNDGYLLQYFKEKKVPVLGIDPTANTAKVAEEKGIPTIVDFFSVQLAKEQLEKEGKKADLIIGNNVLAHVPDINDFVGGLKIALKEKGIITMEFPHLVKLIDEHQFDTIYHEHFSYLSLYSVQKVFNAAGLEIFDVEELKTHGGSLRIFARHMDDDSKPVTSKVHRLKALELEKGINTLDLYSNFQEDMDRIKYSCLAFLMKMRNEGKKVIGYGAAAKGNTLLNYCGVNNNDVIKFVVDASPYKQNKYLPGSHIPVVGMDKIKEYQPDYVIILPWNLKEEISEQLDFIREWGGKFVIFVPVLSTF